MIKKALSLSLALLLFFPTAVHPLSVSAIPYDEYMAGRNEYTSATYELSPGLKYTEVLTENEKYGYERSYVYEYTPMQGTEIIPAYGDYVCTNVDLATLTKELESEGKRVVGGINGDFYSMTTGVPIGGMIVDGEIISSDNDRTAMGFDADGNAFISKPQMITKLTNDENDITIEHINKYPLEYCLYLLTDKFYPTTRSSKESSEIVLMPYSNVEIIKNASEMPDISDDENGEKYIYIYSEKSQQDQEEHFEEEADKDISDEGIIEGTDLESDKSDTAKTETEEPESEEPESEEPEAEEPEAEEYYAKKYTFADEKLSIGCDIPVVVTEIRKDTMNTEIPEGCFVLCAENTLQLDRVKNISEGDELRLSVTANDEWYSAVNAIGNAGGLILKDGEYCDDVEVDHYPYAQPRTAAGITADGRVIFYCVDGRQESSAGLRIDQLSHEMKELGCVIAMNLDGGGSTTAYAALPGEFFSTLKNSPSVNPERKTANSLLFVNTAERIGSEPARFSIYPESPYVLAGGSTYQLSKPIGTDENLYPISLPDDFEYEYFVSPIRTDSKIIEGNIFVSGEKTGSVDIYMRVGEGENLREYRVGSIFVLGEPADFTVGDPEYTISPFDTLKLSFSAEYHTAKIYYDSASLRWGYPLILDESDDEDPAVDYYMIPNEGKLENDVGSIDSDLNFTPKIQDETVILKVKLGTLEKSVIVNIDKFPFNDCFTHWSAKSVYDVYSFNLMQGEPSGEELAFNPERNLSKAEFMTIIARMLYPDIDDENSVSPETSGQTEEQYEDEKAEESLSTTGVAALGFVDDSSIPEWSRKYFDALSESGLLELLAKQDEYGNKTLCPGEYITRREVLVILGALCDEAKADFVLSFVDGETIADVQYYDFINNALAAGIFTGYEDGTLRPENNLTRAEAATVILRFLENSSLN